MYLDMQPRGEINMRVTSQTSKLGILLDTDIYFLRLQKSNNKYYRYLHLNFNYYPKY